MEGHGYEFEVFLSFRGLDTRWGFTDHLYTRLTNAGVPTFRDDEELRIGEECCPDLVGVIHQSKISIPILSRNYASSRWCLMELTTMVECRKRKGQVIMPIFYDVEPSEVRRQTGCYHEALLMHENEKRMDDMTIVEWRAALQEIGGLKGWNVAKSLGGDASIADEVVANVLKVLERYRVGIKDHVEGAMELLNEGRDYEYEVFLNFGGMNLDGKGRHINFFRSLWARLTDAGVRTCRDAEDRPIGTEYKPYLLEAIGQSKISIPFFCLDYAFSGFCHWELAHMVECQKTSGQVILPIFYDVQPSEVRYQTGVYDKAFRAHECKKRVDDETIRNWRAALAEVASIKGWDLQNGADRLGGEASIVDEVVAYVLNVLKGRYIVGIEDHVDKVMELLKVESSDVRVVGIHGEGGTGKTTIAKSFYKRISHLFDGCSFLESVRENAKKPGGLVNLQGQLISDLLGEMHRQTRYVDDGAKSIGSRFLHKKVLIVVDDIEPGFRLTEILGSLDSLGSGSRILITTRDKQALDKLEVEVTSKHNVGGMKQGDALKLFHFHAFGRRPVPHDLATLSKDIVSALDCRPLTIEVFGSYLHLKTKDVWTQTLDELKKVPELGVSQKMIAIIEAFPDKQRQIFLDIACFFIGEDQSVACYLWSDRDAARVWELDMLISSSIVKIENNKLWMHDELRDLGRNMVQREDPEPRNRSRLWILEEASGVLMEEKGTDRVEGVLLKFDSRSQCSFSPAHFASTSNMRFLRLDQANLEGNFEWLLSSLRWLHWQGCPRNLGAENLHLEKLVILDLSWSKVNEKWKGWGEIKKAENLKVLNLTGCVDLIRTPDLSSYKCLERLILENCIRLVEIDSTVKSLQCLVSLNLRFCIELNKLPEELGVIKSLEEILIDGTAVQEIPASIGHMKNLRRFSACNCLSLIQLPDSMSQVASLSFLALNGTRLTKLPTSIGELGRLQHLSISHCRSILKLPTSLGTLAALSELDLSSTAIVKLPDEVEKLKLLKVLKIDFTFVRKLPDAIWKLERLEELHASRCRSLDGEIPGEIKNLLELRVLKLGYSRIRGLPEDICGLPKLQTLDLLHCDELREVPRLPATLVSLSVSSKVMDTIPDISNLFKLGELFLADGSQELVLPVKHQIEAKGRANLELRNLLELKTLRLSLLKIQPVELNYLSKLRKLSLCCIHLEELPQLPPDLFTLSLRHYKSWKKFPDLSYLKLLLFELYDCAVTEVPGLGEFRSLEVFKISHCNFQQLDELENLKFLASLHVSYCQSLERLPNLSKHKKLKDIKIKGCPKIPAIRRVEHLHSFEQPSSSSKVELSKPANNEASSIQGVKHNDKGKDDEDTTGIFPSTDETTDASIIPSTDSQLEGITDGTEGDSLSIPSPPVSQAVDLRSSLARQYKNINSPAIVGIQEPSSMPVSALSPGHSLSQPVGRTDVVGESSSSSARAKVALEQVARILHSRVTNSSNVTSESSVASIITDAVAKAKWTEFLELSQGGFPSIANDPTIAERIKALVNELCGGDIRFTKSPGFRKDCEDFLAVFLDGIHTYQQNCERIAVLVVSEKDCRYPHNSIEEVCRSLKIRQDALQTLVNDRAGLDAEEADLERRLTEVRNQQRLKDIENGTD